MVGYRGRRDASHHRQLQQHVDLHVAAAAAAAEDDDVTDDDVTQC